MNVITDVATTEATCYDSHGLPGIHHRLMRHRPLPAEHFIDSGCTALVHHDAARDRSLDKSHAQRVLRHCRQRRTTL